MKYNYFFCVLCCLLFSQVRGQQIDIENLTKVPKLRLAGGINATGMYYNSSLDSDSTREPFTYMLSGNLNLNWATFNMPISYTLTNQGDQLGYQVPFNFNRLSIAPKYKWIQAYIGDASMSFSNYTLNGHPFTGLGIEFTPAGPLKWSMMGGRLLKAVEGDTVAQLPAVYERYGYGAKVLFEQEKYVVEWITFYAKDRQNSVVNHFDVIPKENWVNSLRFKTTLIKNVNIEAEYALSSMSELNPFVVIVDKETTREISKTKYHKKAFKTALNYKINTYLLGVVYENVDPEYQTLGAMFFNNDLENVGLTFSGPFMDNRLMLSTQLGYQRDNLNGKKQQDSKRLVGSVNATLKITEQLNLSGNYSNFSTYTNRRLDQFDYINDPNMNPADTLNYKQLSQNLNANLNYIFGAQKNQNVNFNYSIAGQANKQGGVIRKGQSSTVQNYNLVHTIQFKATQWALSSSVNYTNNQISTANNEAFGGGLNINKRFFDNSLQSGFGVLYNTSTAANDQRNSVFGLKFNGNYTLLTQHNFSLNGIQMFRNPATGIAMNDLTLNFNYSYSF
ncbi:hypothetical protein [Flavobacterium sp. NKUCC04_CG]|uniref:hypothetical protein n=1 Tax=Flavobacterium sp. NKUCC04_CG TaxID=2842121 RepID=UPI001C5A6A98|nr:hypothetical protein [Flavobacterium sp. NKUCC04_CG]MBW3520004.1 hypothetical protein [Flavobacterium sp. NKUCC04_CG]